MGHYIEGNGARMVWPVAFVLAAAASLGFFLLWALERRHG